MPKELIDQNTALLYFTLSASEQARVKRFTGIKEFSTNRSVAQKLISNTYHTIADAGLPVIIFSSGKQVGASFGERFSNAFEALFAQGYENVIAVGNDCPRLSASQLSKAKHGINNNACVIGPATDGGTYLIGITREAFDKDKFSNLSWESNRLLADLIDYTKEFQYSFTLLQELSDIDNCSDLFLALRHLKQSAFFYLRVFADMLAVIITPVSISYKADFDSFCDLFFIGSSYSHRGPPIFS